MCAAGSHTISPAPHTLFAHTLTHVVHRQWARLTYAIAGASVGPQSCGGNCERGREGLRSLLIHLPCLLWPGKYRENRAVSTNSITAQIPTLASGVAMSIVFKAQWLWLSVAGCPLRLPPTQLDEEHSLLYSVAHPPRCQDFVLY